ncbi:MAG: elongation factor P [Sphingomonadaceae bacterium]
MINVGDIKKGIIIELDGQLQQIIDFQHIKMGRGSAQVRLKFRNVRTGQITDRSFQATEKFQRVRLDHRTVQYLYSDGDQYHFMDTESFDQIALTRDQLDDAVNYLKENVTLELLSYNDQPIGVELPITVDLKIEHTEPGFRGDTATGGTKPATLETGLTVQVPLFVNQGETIRVDTRTGTYLERVG